MIELTLRSGEAVFVNPAHIVSVAGAAGITQIIPVTGYAITVVDTVQTVMDLIEANNKKEQS